MRNKKYIFLAALLVGVFISMSVKCGTTSKCLQYCKLERKPAPAADNYQPKNLLFIKYAF